MLLADVGNCPYQQPLFVLLHDQLVLKQNASAMMQSAKELHID